MKISMRVAAVKIDKHAVKMTEKMMMNAIRQRLLLMKYRARIEMVGRREAIAMVIALANVSRPAELYE